MGKNELYLAIMYAKYNNMSKAIRLFLVSPIKKQGLLKEYTVGFKEIVTNKEIIRKGKDVKNKNVMWEVQTSIIMPRDEILKYISKSSEEMTYIMEDSRCIADEFVNIKKRTK